VQGQHRYVNVAGDGGYLHQSVLTPRLRLCANTEDQVVQDLLLRRQGRACIELVYRIFVVHHTARCPRERAVANRQVKQEVSGSGGEAWEGVPEEQAPQNDLFAAS